MHEICEQPWFAEQAERVLGQLHRKDERLTGVCAVLAADPSVGVPIPGLAKFHMLVSEMWVPPPGLVIYYTFDDKRVYLEGVSLSQPAQ